MIRRMVPRLISSPFFDLVAQNTANSIKQSSPTRAIGNGTPLIDGLGIDGTLLVVGASPEPIEVNPFHVIGERRGVRGWPSGTSVDSEDTMRFSALTGIEAMIETYPLTRAAEAYERMMSGKARFRVVLVP